MSCDAATGMVWVSCPLNVVANAKSFQANTKQSTPVATIPGVTSGKLMRQNKPKVLQPSMRADSSISRGTSAKNACMSQIANGKLKVQYATIKPTSESSKCRCRNMRYNGTMTAAIGAMRVL